MTSSSRHLSRLNDSRVKQRLLRQRCRSRDCGRPDLAGPRVTAGARAMNCPDRAEVSQPIDSGGGTTCVHCFVKSFYAVSCVELTSFVSSPPSIRTKSGHVVVEIARVLLVPCFRLRYMRVCPSRQLASKNHDARHDRDGQNGLGNDRSQAIASGFRLE